MKTAWLGVEWIAERGRRDKCKNGVKCHLSHSTCVNKERLIYGVCLCVFVCWKKYVPKPVSGYIFGCYVSASAHVFILCRHKHICIHSRTFSCRSFQPVTAPRTGLSSSNEKHMCSRRLNLLQAHLLLAKHFHPQLNISVSFLSASSLSMCVAWMNVRNVCVCVCERVLVYVICW